MRLSTSTNLFAYRPDWYTFIPIIESIRRCAAVGFDAIDINLCDVTRPYYLLARDDWQDWVQAVAEAAKACGLPITQSHPPFYNALDESFAQRDEYEAMIRRSIIASGMLGVNWIVMHPGTFPGDSLDFRESKRRNIEYFKPYLDLAAESGCGIAIENLADPPVSSRKRPAHVYGAGVVELCELVDAMGRDNAGICWDFGHANLMGADQPSALRFMGKRLKAVHVADNSGHFDDHIMPFAGKVDWASIMPVLREIDYTGDFTYEIHSATSRLPDTLLDDMGRYCVAVGRYLLSLYEEQG